MRYMKAKLTDIKYMQELVKPEVDGGIILHRSSDEIATNIRSYMLVKDEDRLVGFGALHFHSEELAEVRSLVIDKNIRGKGLGLGLVKNLLEEASEYQIRQVFTLTYQKRFFEKIGFKEIDKEYLPSQKIWADCIKCKHFPVCDEVALIKSM